MDLHKQLGLDDHIFASTPETKERQMKIYGRLVLMIIVLSGLFGIACYTFGAIIFQKQWIAIFTGLIFALIAFNMLKLLLISSISPRNELLYRYWVDIRKLINELRKNKNELYKLNAKEKVGSFLNDHRKSIRLNSEPFKMRKASFTAQITRSLFLVTILVLFGLIVANGIELYLFRAEINDSISDMLVSKEFLLDPWIKKNILTAHKGESFVLINSYSLLLDLELLNRGVGNWKLVLDILVILLFLLPFILLHKSPEFLKGTYVRELVLEEMVIATASYIYSEQKILEINDYFESDEYKDGLYYKLYGFKKPDLNMIIE